MANSPSVSPETDVMLEGGSKPTRRIFTGLATAFVAAAAAGVLGSCKKDDDAARSTPPANPPPPLSPEPPPSPGKLSAPEIEVDNLIKIPEFTFSDTPVRLEKPENLDMSEEEFDQFSKALVNDVIKKGVAEFLIPQLQKINSPEAKMKIILDFISQTANIIEKADPRVEKEMNQFHKTWNQEIDKMIAHINQYINRGGLHWVIQWDGKNMDFEMFEIEKTTSVKVNDGKKEQTFTAIYLGNSSNISPALSDRRNGASGQWEGGDPKRFVLYNTRMDAFDERMIRNGKNYGLIPAGGEGEMTRQARADAIRHEASHAYMGNEFPKTGRMNRMDTGFYAPLVIKRNGKPYVDLRGNYHPVFFHEIAGVGIQMARSEMKNPIHLVTFCANEQELSPSYKLLALILPLAILQVAPESEMKQQFLRKLDHDGTLDYMELRKLVKETMTGDHQRKVGELLFRFAMSLFQNAEKVAE